MEKEACGLPKAHADRQALEEPMKGFIHGPPSAGKGFLMYWICGLFTEALGREHGVQFLCVGIQTRVRHAMGGATLHTCGDVGVGGLLEAHCWNMIWVVVSATALRDVALGCQGGWLGLSGGV